MFAKLVSFVLILIGLWSLFRFVARIDQGRRQHRQQGRRAERDGHSSKVRRGQKTHRGQGTTTQHPRTGAIVEADPMVQCKKCKVFHEAGRRCPDCYPKG